MSAPAYAVFARLAVADRSAAALPADSVVLVFPNIAGLPPLLTALVAVGALMAILASAS
jgi:Na+(H+)/acetate symporter ActP